MIVAELLGHARLETTRAYTPPSAEDRLQALDLLLVDKSRRSGADQRSDYTFWAYVGGTPSAWGREQV